MRAGLRLSRLGADAAYTARPSWRFTRAYTVRPSWRFTRAYTVRPSWRFS